MIFVDDPKGSAEQQGLGDAGPTPQPDAERRALDGRDPARPPEDHNLRGGLRLTGMVAPIALDGQIDGRSFQAYVDQVLVPDLTPGDVVGMDNLGSHKGQGVRAAIEAAGARLSEHEAAGAAALRLAEKGASPHEIMSVRGHQTLEEAERYTRTVNRVRLAMSALARLDKDED